MGEHHGHHWAHVRAHAAEGGIYATCLAELCDHVNEVDKSSAGCIVDLRRSVQLLVDALAKAGERLKALEERLEVQVLPTTPQEGGPTLLAPIQLQQGTEPAGELVERVQEAVGLWNPGDARLAIREVAQWLDEQHSTSGAGCIAARLLLEEVGRG